MYFITQKSKKLKNYNNKNRKSIFFFRKSLFLLLLLLIIRYVREIFTKCLIVFEIKNDLYDKNHLECNYVGNSTTTFIIIAI